MALSRLATVISGLAPGPSRMHPIEGQDRVVLLKPLITSPLIEGGEYSCYDHSDHALAFQTLTGSAHQVKGHEERGPRDQESPMLAYLLHDEYTPQELARGRS